MPEQLEGAARRGYMKLADLKVDFIDRLGKKTYRIQTKAGDTYEIVGVVEDGQKERVPGGYIVARVDDVDKRGRGGNVTRSVENTGIWPSDMLVRVIVYSRK